MHSLFVRIADITIAIVNDNPELKLWVEGATQKFLEDKANPEVRIQAAWGDLVVGNSEEKIFDSGALWQLYSENGSYLFRFTSLALGSLPYKVATFNWDFTSGEVYLHRPYFTRGQPLYPLEYPLDELLIMNLLARGRGVEVHACGIIDSKGKGHLFVGQSGAGKTTIARIWHGEAGVTVLSDDRIILRKIENKIWMYGTPWHGEAELASPAQAPLTRAYFLNHGLKNEILQQGRVEALARLFACSFVPFYSSETLDFTVGFFEEVVKTVPCYELRFVPDKGVIEFLQGRIV